MNSHCDGETWGLDVCNLENGETRIITSGDDNRIICVDPKTWKVLCEGKVTVEESKKKKKKPKGGYVGGASSMSSQPPEN